jgi:hypothetical protein
VRSACIAELIGWGDHDERAAALAERLLRPGLTEPT